MAPSAPIVSEARNDRDHERLTAPFATRRLIVRPAAEDDAAFIAGLWSDPRVTRFVGFPHGIPSALDDVPRRIRRGVGLTALWVALDAAGREPIGQCLLGAPDAEGVAEPDIKLAPAFWGQGYGKELWAAIVDQVFLRSACAAVRGTPNVANVASIRMQKAAGMRRVGRGVSEFPVAMRAYAEPVTYYVYELTRGEWLARRVSNAWPERDVGREPDGTKTSLTEKRHGLGR